MKPSTLFIPPIVLTAAIVVGASVEPWGEGTLIPGPGLPSLESLNLTIADLWNDGKLFDDDTGEYYYLHRAAIGFLTMVGTDIGPATEHNAHLDKRYNPWCWGYRNKDPYGATVNDATICLNYLKNLGTASCRIPARNAPGDNWGIFCTWGGNPHSGVVFGASCKDRQVASYW